MAFGPGGGAGGPGGGFSFNTDDLGDLGDLFGGLFGRGRGGGRRGGPSRGPGPQRGADLETELHLSFDDAVHGLETTLHLTSDAACSTCAGSGAKPGTAPMACPICKGLLPVLKAVAQDERRLDVVLASDGSTAAAHRRFLPLNARFQEAVTRWQIRPLPGDAMAANDHTDHRWDDRVLEALASLGRRLGRLEAELTAGLPRFSGYALRYDLAFQRVTRGDHRWLDGVGIDSCHVVWMQLHEDLIATLGLVRGNEE